MVRKPDRISNIHTTKFTAECSPNETHFLDVTIYKDSFAPTQRVKFQTTNSQTPESSPGKRIQRKRLPKHF